MQTPPILALHLNRSAYYGHYASKNSCSVIFPEVLDLTPFTTSGALSIAPQAPISKPASALPPRSSTPTPSVYSAPRVLYRLASVVCHYGAHSFGHYVAYRRKPRDPSHHSSRWTPPQLQCPYGCECEKCQLYGPIRDSESGEHGSRSGKGRFREDVWLRISDDQVKEVGLSTVLAETTGSFMLYYEKVLPFHSESVRTSPRSSQETVTPHDLQEERKSRMEEIVDQSISARIVRSVSMGTVSREGSVYLGINGDSIKPNGYANGHADPNHHYPPLSDKEPAHTNGSPQLLVSPTSPLSIPLSASPVRSNHHLPRSPSPVRTLDLRA
jgi:ubiquitin carboxyl-terminal hydrolase 1